MKRNLHQKEIAVMISTKQSSFKKGPLKKSLQEGSAKIVHEREARRNGRK